MSKHRAKKRQRDMIRVALLVILAAPFLSITAHARAIAIFKSANITITLTDEDCKLKDQVTNLPKRAVWKEGETVYEGCFGTTQFRMIQFYFSDKTATSIPIQFFEMVTET